MMSHSVSSGIAGVALTMLVAAGARPTTKTGFGSAASVGSSTLSGTGHGYFVHAGADYTSPSNTDLTLQVGEDSTYTFKWENRPQRTGTAAVQGSRVILADSSGSRIALVQSGDTLYGVMKDTGTGRAVMMSLEKQATVAGRVATASARRCEAAGGIYSHGVCRPVTDRASVAQLCEARGGAYFAGGDYCEVPAGGLAPR